MKNKSVIMKIRGKKILLFFLEKPLKTKVTAKMTVKENDTHKLKMNRKSSKV